jgi:3-oxoacyl-[acyl-carrier-protein] synthase II
MQNHGASDEEASEMNARYTRADRQRIVVTGLGAVSPLGLDVTSTWQGLVEGRSGVSTITAFDTRDFPTKIAASVKGFDPTHYLNQREARRMSLFVLYTLAAAYEAVAQARLDLSQQDATRVGVEIGSALGGVSLVEEQRLILESKGSRQINPTLVPAILINTAPCMVAIQLGIKGPVSAPVSACASGAMALGDAARRLAWGDADVMLAGGAESVMTPLAIVGFSRLGALSTKNDTPEKACAPFDANRDGTVVGEGAAVLVLETLAHALRRDAPILAEVLGYGLTCDAHHPAAPDPNGDGAARAMVGALHDGGISPAELDWICAHGTGTPLNDTSETKAIKIALGGHAHDVPVSSNKGAVGHMIGAAGAISTVAAVQAMHTGLIPPTLNYQTPDPECDLDYVPNVAREAAVNTVMINSFGFGGQNACLVLRKWDRR